MRRLSRSRTPKLILGMVLILTAMVVAGAPTVAGQSSYASGNRAYIYSSSAFSGGSTEPAVLDLDALARGVGAGAGTRAHLLLFNNTYSHALLANVASGHVQFIDAANRKVVGSVDVGEQAHGALAAPDDSFALVANQNGKKLAKISTDYANNVYRHNPSNDFDLRALEDAGHPDNAPICPILWAQGGFKAYVTLRGGGLYVIDTASTPMKLLKSWNKDEVKPAGCGGAVVGSRMYINSGSATSANLYLFDTSTDTLVKEVELQSPGTDAHGITLVNRRYLWMGYRGTGDRISIIDTLTDKQVSSIGGFGDAPDLMDVSPAGDLVFATLRGPNNLTGGAPAKGSTPGLAVFEVKDGGAAGAKKVFLPIGPQNAQSPADPHAVAVRPGFGPGSPYEVWVVDQSDRAAPGAPATGSGQAELETMGRWAALAMVLSGFAFCAAWFALQRKERRAAT